MWLKGSLFRNGPGKQRIGPDEFQHLFDCCALIRKYDIENGKVTYKNRFLQSETFKKNMNAQRIVVTEFGTKAIPDPCKTLLQRFMSYFTFNEIFTDNNLVGFIEIKDQLYSVAESPFYIALNEKTLEPIESYDLRNIIALANLTAHPHLDAESGDVYNMGSSVGYYNIVKIPKELGLPGASIVSKIKTKRPLAPSYYHSFSITENYFIFIEQPLVLSLATVVKDHFVGGTNCEIFRWIPEYKVSNYHN